MLPISPNVSQALPSGPPNLGAGQVPEAAAMPQALQSDVAAFRRMADNPVHEVQATPVQDAGSLTAHLSSGLQDVSVQLSEWQKSHVAAPPAVTSSHAGNPSFLTQSVADAVAGMQGAYVFAIETTLASRGSTELTKVFNTLLKGQ